MRRLYRLLRLVQILVKQAFLSSFRSRGREGPEKCEIEASAQKRAGELLINALNFKVSVAGVFPQNEAFLIASNHISAFDPFVICAHLLVSIAGKAELNKMPVLGWVCRSAGLIFVDRSKRMQAKIFVEQVDEKLKAGVSVLVFPEGTTSDGVKLKPFKTSAFDAVAGKPDAKVLPVYLQLVEINGVSFGQALRPHYVWSDDLAQNMIQHAWTVMGLNNARLVIHVGTPISAEGKSRKELADDTFDAVSRLKVNSEQKSVV